MDGDVNDGEWDGDEAEELGGGRAKESLEAERGSWEEESIYHTISRYGEIVLLIKTMEFFTFGVKQLHIKNL